MATDAAGINPKVQKLIIRNLWILSLYIKNRQNTIYNYTERMTNMPSREEMIAYITENIQATSDLELEEIYWLVLENST